MKKTCKVKGCGRTIGMHGARGCCSTHYKRIIATGTPQADKPIGWRPTRPQKPCKVNRCERPHWVRGYCRSHYDRVMRTGSPQAETPIKPVSPGGGKCKVEGCDMAHWARGYCATHYSRWWNTGSAQADRPVRRALGGPCRADGCEKQSKTRGYCTTHYARLHSHGDVFAHLPIKPKNQAPGTKIVRKDGYVYVKIPGHPNAHKAGWIKESRLVMSEMMGRALKQNEKPIHINGDVLNSSRDNLMLLHSTIGRLKVCCRCGVTLRVSQSQGRRYKRFTCADCRANGDRAANKVSRKHREEIRQKRANGWNTSRIAKEYAINLSSVNRICIGIQKTRVTSLPQHSGERYESYELEATTYQSARTDWRGRSGRVRPSNALVSSLW